MQLLRIHVVEDQNKKEKNKEAKNKKDKNKEETTKKTEPEPTNHEKILDILLESPFYINFQKFVEINLDESSEKIKTDRMKKIDSYLYKKMGFKSEPKGKLDISKIEPSCSKDNFVKYLLDFKNSKEKQKGSDIGVDFDKKLKKEESTFIQLVYSLAHYHYKPEIQEKFKGTLQKYQDHLIQIDILKRNDEWLKNVMSTNCSLLIQMAIIKNQEKAIIQLMDMKGVDINEIMLRCYNEKFVYHVAEKGKHALLKKCLDKPNLKMSEKCGKDKTTSLFSKCLLGNQYTNSNKDNAKGDDYKKDYTDEYKLCIDLLVKDKKFESNFDEIDPMYDAMKHRNDYAKKKLIDTFGLLKIFVVEMDKKSLEVYLNSCVKKVGKSENEIEINFPFLNDVKSEKVCHKEDDNSPENMLFELTKNDNLRELIRHPVLSAYIKEKCDRFNKLYYLNSAMFVGLFIIPLVYKYFCGSDILLLAFFYLLVRECFQLYLSWCCECKHRGTWNPYYALEEHFSTYTNKVEFILIISTGVASWIAPFFEDEEKHIAYKIAFIIMVLLGTLEVTILFTETVHRQSKYMLMLSTVSKTYATIMSIVIIFNTAFAFCFHILFYERVADPNNDDSNNFNHFYTFITSLLKITVMFGGEYEAKDMDDGSDLFITVFFIGCVLSIIILSNYVNALAIADIRVKSD